LRNSDHQILKAYRSAKSEAHFAAGGFISGIHRNKRQGKSMPQHVSRANAAKSVVRAHVERVCADLWDRRSPPAARCARRRQTMKTAHFPANLSLPIWRKHPPRGASSRQVSQSGGARTAYGHVGFGIGRDALIRSVLTVAGTALVAMGYVQASDIEPVIGALLTIGSVVWPVADKRLR
jgi:hypothetical protein